MKSAAKTRTSKTTGLKPSARAGAVKGHAPAFREIVGLTALPQERWRATAVQDAFARAWVVVIRASVLDCASPLALCHRQPIRLRFKL